MMITIDASGQVHATWVSEYGAHDRNVTAEIPADLLAALLAWGVKREAELIAENRVYETERELDREIRKLEQRKAELRGR